MIPSVGLLPSGSLTQRLQTPAFAIFAVILSAISFVSFLRTSLMDPGVIPRVKKRKTGRLNYHVSTS